MKPNPMDIKAATLTEAVKNANLLLGINTPIFNFKLRVQDEKEKEGERNE